MARISDIKKDERLKPLFLKAKKLGVRVSFLDYAVMGWAFGAFSRRNKRIEIALRRPDGKFFSKADIAFVFAHELRHAEHFKNNKYAVYYSDKETGITKKDRDVAYAAELDCDKAGRIFINKFFPNENSKLRNRVYPRWRVSPLFTTRKERIRRDIVRLHYSKPFSHFSKQLKQKKLFYLRQGRDLTQATILAVRELI